MRWSDIPYIVIDTETTGLSAKDRVCEITAALCISGEIKKAVTSLVNPGISIPSGATAIHGITDADVRDAPKLEDVADEIIVLLSRDAPWVAHNMAFDIRMLRYDIDQSRIPRGIPTLCTLEYARRSHPELSRRVRHRLIDVAQYFELPFSGLHRSYQDVELLARIVPRLVGDLTVGETMTKWSHEW